MRTIECVGTPLDRVLGRFKGRSTSATINLRSKSPWAEGDLSQILFADALGIEIDDWPITRSSAIQIPAVSKARNLLIATIRRFPLVALGEKWRPATNAEKESHPYLVNEQGNTQLIADQPVWLSRTDGPVGPGERMAWTIDSMFFDGITLWRTKRGEERDNRRPILDGAWVPPENWTITEGNVLIDEQQVEDHEYILLNSPFDGLLNVGDRTLRGARDVEKAWTARIKNPIPLTEMRVTDPDMKPKQAEKWSAAWGKKHRAGEPAFGMTPPGVEMHTHGEDADSGMYIESRNAIRTDVGSFTNIRASMLDGTAGIDSLTYSTTKGEKNAFYEFDLPFWTDPIEEALSSDKVVPRGTRIRFDKYAAYSQPTPTGVPTKD